MSKVIGFLRGINLGRRRIKMADLRQSFEKMGLANAQTLIASGNVLFDAEMTPDLGHRIEAGLLADFGFEVPTILRTIDELRALAALRPFRDHPDTDNQKRYVLFLARPETNRITAPLNVSRVYDVVRLTAREVFVVGYRQPDGRTSEAMEALATPFKDAITTRNWNTIEKMIAKAEG